MNLVFTYVFDDLFINSFDFSKLSSLSKSLDSETLWEMAYEENIGIEGIATWVYNPARNTILKSGANCFDITDAALITTKGFA